MLSLHEASFPFTSGVGSPDLSPPIGSMVRLLVQDFVLLSGLVDDLRIPLVPCR
jgi:hypothetical protein